MDKHQQPGNPFVGLSMLATTISKYWCVLLLRGPFAIIFGVTAMIWPGLALFWLVWLFGVLLVGFACRARKGFKLPPPTGDGALLSVAAWTRA
jgi:hypothetical protein